jgi:signal transduction histidine kinase
VNGRAGALEAIADAATTALLPARCALLTLAPGSAQLLGTLGREPLQIELTRLPLAARALSAREPQGAADGEGGGSEAASALGFAPRACVPLHVGEEPVGVLVLDREDEALDRAIAFARVSSLALASARNGDVPTTLAQASRAARELHDDVAQLLFSIGSIAKRLGAERTLPTSARTGVESILRLSGQASRQLRSAIESLHGGSLTQGLGPALEEVVEATRARTQLEIELYLDHDLRVASGVEADVIYRVCREGLANVERHAEAARCRVDCSLAGGLATATVEDDGVGVEDTPSGEHFGLRFLTEAVAGLGGSLAIERRPPRGTRLTAKIPVRA